MKSAAYYKAKYQRFIEERRNRFLDGHMEIHHILPRCLGGTDNKHNLIALTPREHYIAHVFLYKIYPTNSKIVKALSAMKLGNGTVKYNRSINSKEYEFIKKAISKQIPPKETLFKLYKTKLLSFSKIAKIYNVSDMTVRKWIHYYEITLNVIKDYRGKAPPTKKELTLTYNSYNKQVKLVAKHYNVSKAIVYKWLKLYKVELVQVVGKEKPLPTKFEIVELYCTKKYTMVMLRKHYKVSRSLLQKWFKIYNIQSQKNRRSRANVF